MISVAIQKGDYVYVYDEKNRNFFTIFGTLAGYTSGTVSIRKGDYIYTYDDKKRQVSVHFSK